MSSRPHALGRLSFHLLTAERWPDLVTLFGERGACAGCWCMWWRSTRAQFASRRGAGNRRDFRRLVMAGRTPGLLAYANGGVIGWCAIEPRASYPALERSRILKPIDAEPVWSVPCFFVARSHRRRGLTVRLLKEAVQHARRHGARIVEGYPVDTGGASIAAAAAYTGTVAAFRAAGFREAERRARSRPILRRTLRAAAKPRSAAAAGAERAPRQRRRRK